MKLDKYTDSLRADLAAAAALGDEHTRRTAEALGAAAEASARLMLLGALSEFAAEISTELDDRSVHVRLDGTDAVGEVRRRIDEAGSDDRTSSENPDAPDGTSARSTDDYPTMEDVTGEMRRVTLRMVEHMKDRAEEAASSNGVSLNSWLSQAVQGALRDQMRKERPNF
ncbi:Arc family DNA-binding protein [Rhodococcoides yunnanense]|uniref:Arc family DNA-binding protein n=1 Tax=Rhodococcoides yunnanense TaxID=278209 RepID=UPI0009320F78|nr:Arc family DNA-binding protein [Rhodococcus yunnanensis]